MAKLGAMDAAGGFRAVEQAEQAADGRVANCAVPQQLDGRFARVVVEQPQAVVAGDEIVSGARPRERFFQSGADLALLASTPSKVCFRRFARRHWRQPRMAKAIDRRSNAADRLLDEMSAQLVEFPRGDRCR